MNHVVRHVRFQTKKPKKLSGPQNQWKKIIQSYMIYLPCD